MSRPKTDPDDKQCSPAVMASLLGWHRPGAHAGWSWQLLLDVAHKKFLDARYDREAA